MLGLKWGLVNHWYPFRDWFSLSHTAEEQDPGTAHTQIVTRAQEATDTGTQTTLIFEMSNPDRARR